MTNYIPLATTLVSAFFAAMLLRQYLQRSRIHQLVWTVAMFLYALTAGMEFLANPDVLGPSVPLIKVYYVPTAPMVALLGAGVLYLLAPRRAANYFLGFVIVLSVILVTTGLTAQIDAGEALRGFQVSLPHGFRDAARLFPFIPTRLPTIILNSVGAALLIGGALYSFARDRARTYNLFLAAGGILPAAGGFSLGILGNPDVFFEFELGGTVFLFLGFILSARYIAKREALRRGATNP